MNGILKEFINIKYLGKMRVFNYLQELKFSFERTTFFFKKYLNTVLAEF